MEDLCQKRSRIQGARKRPLAHPWHCQWEVGAQHTRSAPLYFYKPEQHLNTRKQYCHADKTKLDMLDDEVEAVEGM